jgi:holo-[acyl-carrier protein] synthase
MIRGVGVDIIEITRVGDLTARYGERFLRKIFTPAEIQYCTSRHHAAQHLAARFAAKEALSKALATGWTGTFRWTDIETRNEPSGRPVMTVHGPLHEVLTGAALHVSLSHSASHVVAVVIIEDISP